jgi:serine protease inhibitor
LQLEPKSENKRPDDKMQSAKDFALRRFPKLYRWLFPEAEADHAAAAAGNGLQAFSLGLTKRLADDAGRSHNLVFSPLSLYAALSLVAAGARDLFFRGSRNNLLISSFTYFAPNIHFTRRLDMRLKKVNTSYNLKQRE